jgi:hypothetical protein
VREAGIFYFSVTYCLLPFVFKGSMFESENSQTVLFSKTHVLELFLFCKVC